MPARNPRTFSQIEAGSATLNSSGESTINFLAFFDHPPIVTLTEYDDDGAPNNVALIITNVSRTGMTVKASAGWETGQTYYYHAIG